MESRGPPKVKNKAAAPVQISAEQLLREANDRRDVALQAPKQQIADLEELHEYQGRKRKEFEDYIRRNRIRIKNWLQYAEWELEQKEFGRARSIFERALDVMPNEIGLWIRYCEAEMMTRNVNHARNLFDRAVTHLPRCDKLWYKYVYMEEMLGNVPGTRRVYERWMQWRPDEAAWSAYIKLEKRYGETDKARDIFRMFTSVHPQPRTWLKWAKFEQEFGTSDKVRDVFGMAVEALGDISVDERLFIAYARFESGLKEYERARAIYKYALDRLPRSRSAALHAAYTKFEKEYGDQEGIEQVVLSKRRAHYQEQVRLQPKNYDSWFGYARLEEAAGDHDRTREVYERAIAEEPPTDEKRHWRRYIYLWLFYAAWEETEGGDTERARQIYAKCLGLVPHRKFTFAKVWLQAARFEIRHGQLTAARKLLGRALGMCPKDRIFRGYLELEAKLFEFERCRTLHAKRIEWNPANCQAWIKFTELERAFEDYERSRAIFELALSDEGVALDMPELLWKEYIDFEEEAGEYGRVRELYERLLEKTSHVKVWVSYAHFEVTAPDGEEEEEEEDEPEQEQTVSEAAKMRARKVFERAHKVMRDHDWKKDRKLLLDAWLSFERAHGTAEEIGRVERQMPREVRMRREIDDGDGNGTAEEYIDYVFPADDRQTQNLSSLLSMSRMWKQGGIANNGSMSAT